MESVKKTVHAGGVYNFFNYCSRVSITLLLIRYNG